MLYSILATSALIAFPSPVELPVGLHLSGSLFHNVRVEHVLTKQLPKKPMTMQQQYIDDLYRLQMKAMPQNNIEQEKTIGYYTLRDELLAGGSEHVYIQINNFYRFAEGKE